MRLVALGLVALVVAACSGESSGAGSATTVRLVSVAKGLAAPVFVTEAPGNSKRLYVVEQPGRIRVVERGRVRPAPFLDIRSRVVYGGERGLLGLAFAPDYARTGIFYVNYTAAGSGATVIDRYRARAGRVLTGSRRTILRVDQPYANHNGGNLVFGPDGQLWVGLGDGGSADDPENRSQNMQTLLGKMFRLDVRKQAPTPEIVALGLRNPWRYSFDRKTGDLWIGDVGQYAIEEIDVLPRSSNGLVNFGWALFEGRASYLSDKERGPGRLVQPVAQYTHDDGCSVTGGYVYRGKAVPNLVGRYVFGDYCSGIIWSMPASGGDIRVEPIKVPDLTSFGQSSVGELYAVSGRGTIYRLAP